MIMPEKLSLSDFVSRRLHPMKVTIKLLGHEIEQNSDGEVTTIDAQLLGSVVKTIELFVEDYERLLDKTTTAAPKPAPAVERKFVGDDVKQ